MFTFYHYSLEPSSTVPQGPNALPTSHHGFNQQTLKVSWCPWGQEIFRAELKLYLSPYSSPRMPESARGGYHSAWLRTLLPWKWVTKGSNGTHTHHAHTHTHTHTGVPAASFSLVREGRGWKYPPFPTAYCVPSRQCGDHNDLQEVTA